MRVSMKAFASVSLAAFVLLAAGSAAQDAQEVDSIAQSVDFEKAVQVISGYDESFASFGVLGTTSIGREVRFDPCDSQAFAGLGTRYRPMIRCLPGADSCDPARPAPFYFVFPVGNQLELHWRVGLDHLARFNHTSRAMVTCSDSGGGYATVSGLRNGALLMRTPSLVIHPEGGTVRGTVFVSTSRTGILPQGLLELQLYQLKNGSPVSIGRTLSPRRTNDGVPMVIEVEADIATSFEEAVVDVYMNLRVGHPTGANVDFRVWDARLWTPYCAINEEKPDECLP
jgi:hypothetical protein